MSGWTLEKLQQALPGSRRQGDAEIAHLQIDSREIASGDLFAALPGLKFEGLDFLPQALKAGAVAVLVAEGQTLPPELPALFCEDVRRDAGRIAHLLAGDPTLEWPLVGITGTNGKTTSAYLLRHLLYTGDREWGLLGSVDYQVGGRSVASSHTTPDAARLALYLAEMAKANLAGAVMECSSHAIDQKRIAGCRYAGALFTNLSRDHLDYHKDMERYFEAKCGLLTYLEPGAPAVYNMDDPYMSRIGELYEQSVSYGMQRGADLGLVKSECHLHYSRLSCEWKGESLEFTSPLLGEFNVENLMGVLALALSLGASASDLSLSLASFPGVPGRMERVGEGIDPVILLDFAHTPDAIEKVAAACRSLCQGELRILFGAGGDRDKGKRPLMAKAAQGLADRVILTSDNPRSEDPELILDDVEAGFDPAAASWTRIVDRREAIAVALSGAGKGDMILILGKGHETSQEISGEKFSFDERQIVLDALSREKGGA
ncbi:UDP-N-acetylmuramoyl-L-alanyl-D-glutamate--2,6-diaminopimelate ligase [bacterium]|nr:UDP-N-acetylmuramoyl-L-alanyl-D-glutamate--2,6-diaminopimelate ligase [bacterium]